MKEYNPKKVYTGYYMGEKVSLKPPVYTFTQLTQLTQLTQPHIRELTDEEFISVYRTWSITGNDPLVLKEAVLRKAQDKC